MNLVEKIKMEIKSNVNYSTAQPSVLIPKKDLELLITLAEENQARLDLKTAGFIMELLQKQCKCADKE